MNRALSLSVTLLIRLAWLLGGGRKWHMPLMLWWMKRRGMRIDGVPIYISAQTWFDGSDYSQISLGDKVVISSGVRILTHDYAISRALEAIGEPPAREVAFIRPVSIGANSFIGTYSIVMPGARIGRNVIVSAGSVVKGEVPDDSIVGGNPCEVIGNTLEYARKRRALLDSDSARFDSE